uniref:Poly [ADP-ribose] polymerase n=1 Tax=Dermatophagoides pteronyssinus TaxID=6956 RepID=A0A6P6XRZ9_DERPT|nr:tankyrase-2-like [Dermatophagoides pteronyssinus]
MIKVIDSNHINKNNSKMFHSSYPLQSNLTSPSTIVSSATTTTTTTTTINTLSPLTTGINHSLQSSSTCSTFTTSTISTISSISNNGHQSLSYSPSSSSSLYRNNNKQHSQTPLSISTDSHHQHTLIPITTQTSLLSSSSSSTTTSAAISQQQAPMSSILENHHDGQQVVISSHPNSSTPFSISSMINMNNPTSSLMMDYSSSSNGLNIYHHNHNHAQQNNVSKVKLASPLQPSTSTTTLLIHSPAQSSCPSLDVYHLGTTVPATTATSIMVIKDIFQACRIGDLNRLKKLINLNNVNVRDPSGGGRSTPLHFASGFGRLDVVDFLIQQGANIHAKDDGGLVPLHNACSFGHIEVVKLLLKNGADPNVKDNWHFTPLMEAAIKGKLEVCLYLLQKGADARLTNSEGKNALELASPLVKPVLTGDFRKHELLEAARNGYEEKVLSLLTPLNVNCHASDGRRSTPLHLAAGYNRLKIVQILLKSGGNVHAKDKGGLVPLHNACSYGHFEVCELLIKHGAEVNASDHWQFTPLHEAAAKMRIEVCSLLLAHGADPTLVNCHNKSVLDICPTPDLQDHIMKEYRGHQFLDAIISATDISKLKKFINAETIQFKHPFTGNTALHIAVSLNCSITNPQMTPKLRKQIIDLLIRKSPGMVNEKNGQFLTPLHLASDRGHTDLMEVLLKHGAKINAVDSLGQTALHRASRNGQLSSVQTLLSYGADLMLVNIHGLTAEQMAATEQVQKLIASHRLTSRGNPEHQLLEAARQGELDLVRTILSKYPHLVNCRDIDGRQSTPLHFAAGYNRIDVVEYLLEHGANVRAKDKGGLVPLHNACSYGHFEVAELLLKKGANVNATDLWKYTALHEAASKGKIDIVKLLLRHGADVTKKNRDGDTPLDLVKPDDVEISDLLLGNVAILDAAKKGELGRLMRLVSAENVNCRDSQGRNSTPLHLAAGYNNFEVTEFLLDKGADVNAPDKGGLIPLHNAASYGHLDIAALLIKHDTNVNATDRWGFTPLHEAAQKGRTQLCALLLAHGADPTMKNYEGQTALDLASAEDVKCLLMDAQLEPPMYSTSSGIATATSSSNTITSTTNQISTTSQPSSEQQITTGTIISTTDQNQSIANHQSQTESSSSTIQQPDLMQQLIRQIMIIVGNNPNVINSSGDTVTSTINDPLSSLSIQSNESFIDGSLQLLQSSISAESSSKQTIQLNNESVPSSLALLLSQRNADNVNGNRCPENVLANNNTDNDKTIDYKSIIDDTSADNISKINPQPGDGSSDVTQTIQTNSSQSINQHSTHPTILANNSDNVSVSNNNGNNNNKLTNYLPVSNIPSSVTVPMFLSTLGLDFITPILMREHITMDILAEMGHEELKAIGVSAYGHRHRILKGIEKLLISSSTLYDTIDGSGLVVRANNQLEPLKQALNGNQFLGTTITNANAITVMTSTGAVVPLPSAPSFATTNNSFQSFLSSKSSGSLSLSSTPGISMIHTTTFLIQLSSDDREYRAVEDEMQSTIREHKDGGQAGGVFTRYQIIRIQKMINLKLWQRYLHRRQEILEENHGFANERMLFHGSPFINSIVQKGFDERHAYIGGMFGAGIYFAENSSKSNQYVYGICGGSGCPMHKDRSCYQCKRQMLLCRTALGKSFFQFSALKMAHAPPGHHSIIGRPSGGGLSFPEYVIYRGEQAYPEYIITYQIIKPGSSSSTSD